MATTARSRRVRSLGPADTSQPADRFFDVFEVDGNTGAERIIHRMIAAGDVQRCVTTYNRFCGESGDHAIAREIDMASLRYKGDYAMQFSPVATDAA